MVWTMCKHHHDDPMLLVLSCSSWIWDDVKLNDGNVEDDTTSIYNWFTYDDGGAGDGL
jgi:hypothetical protein